MNKLNKTLRKITTGLRLMLVLGCLIAPMVSAQHPAAASTVLGPIAYVRPNSITGDEIHLIEADGTNDRILWETGVSRPAELVDIQQLTWKPDASELAFTSSHEADCSLYQSDVYALRSDGQEYRRVSGPPACGNPDGLPTGTVHVPVENGSYDESGPFTIYFEGAPGPIEIALAPYQSTVLTFTNVADFGIKNQSAVAIYGDARSFYPDAKVDVQPGQTVETGVLVISTGFEHYGFQWPSYRLDGTKIASIFNKSELYQVDSENRVPGVLGSILPVTMPVSSDFLTWGPTATRADQFLYEGWQDSDTIFLGNASTGSSQLIMTIDPLRIGKSLLGLAWLPDGSGFLYSVSEMVNYVDKADLFVYSFATKQSTRLTNLSYGFIRRITVSPDAQMIAFEYQEYGYWYEENPVTDLYVIDLNEAQAYLLAENSRAPAWSPTDLPELIENDNFIFLPAVLKP